MTLKGTCESAYCLKMDNGSVNETSKSVTAPFKTSAEVSEKAIFFIKSFVRNLFPWPNVRTAIPGNYFTVKQPDSPMKSG